MGKKNKSDWEQPVPQHGAGGMKAKNFILLMVLFAVITAGVQFAVNNMVPVKWEYRTYYWSPREKGQFFGADLQEMGGSGWELVSAVPKGQDLICILKRPSMSSPDAEDEESDGDE